MNCTSEPLYVHGISLSQLYTMLWFFLLSDPADFPVAFFEHLMHYYEDELTRQHFTCHGHYYGRSWNWFVEKMLDLLVGAYLCYGLQSQSPTDPHLYAYVGMDCNPRAQGTHRTSREKRACVCCNSPTLHLCPMQLQAVRVVHTPWWMRFLLGYYQLFHPRWGHLRHKSWVHHPIDGEPTTPPLVAHENGNNTAPVVRTLAKNLHNLKKNQKASQASHKGIHFYAHHYLHHASWVCQIAPSSKRWWVSLE